MKLLSPNRQGYNPNSYCNFHQAIGHSTDTCMCLKNEIQDFIDAGRIIDPENPSTKNNPFPNYNTMMINLGVSEEEVLNSFENISLQINGNTPDAPKRSQKGVEDLLGQPSGKFDYKVFYSKPPSYDIPIESIIPGGWGDEFEDDGPVSEKDKKAEKTEQPL